MLSRLQNHLPILPFVIFFMMAVQLTTSWVMVRFVHYHSQYQTLPAESYRAELVTAEDYAKLQDRSLEAVELSNGTTIADRQPIWFERVLPNYKPVDGRYVLVTTFGTAHYYDRWLGDVLPLVFLTVGGAFVTWLNLRNRKKT